MVIATLVVFLYHSVRYQVGSVLYCPALEEHYDMRMPLLMCAPSVLAKATEPGNISSTKIVCKFYGMFRIAQARPNDALSISLVTGPQQRLILG